MWVFILFILLVKKLLLWTDAIPLCLVFIRHALYLFVWMIACIDAVMRHGLNVYYQNPDIMGFTYDFYGYTLVKTRKLSIYFVTLMVEHD